MLDTSNCDEYLTEVRAFADKVGKREQLEKQLTYLAEYANHKTDNHKTKCVLRKDFAPYSFEFAVLLRERDMKVFKYECDKCGEKVESEDDSYHNTRCFGSCEGMLKIVGVVNRHQDEKFWFNGGLIFHGPHDGGGNGGAPTFSVSLTPQDGWSIHT